MKTGSKRLMFLVAVATAAIVLFAIAPKQEMISAFAKTVSGNTVSGNTKKYKKSEDYGRLQREAAAKAAQAKAAEEAKRKANTVVRSNGAEVQSSLPTSVSMTRHAIAAATPANIMNAAVGAQGNQFVQLTAFESSAAQSPAAWSCLQAVVSQFAGATADDSMIQVNMSVVTPGSPATHAFIPAESGATATLIFQVNSGTPAGKTVAVARVVDGGVTGVYADEDADSNTVTVTVSAGNAAYLLFWY